MTAYQFSIREAPLTGFEKKGVIVGSSSIMRRMNHSQLRASAIRVTKGLVPAAALLVFLGFLVIAPPGLLGKADALGYAVCHRIDARSFHIGTRQFPLCARCSGMYLGALLGLVFLTLTVPKRAGMPSKGLFVPLGLLVIAFGVDGVNSYFTLMREIGTPLFSSLPTLYEPNNTLRLLTGTGMGLVIAMVLFPAFNQTLWSDWDPRPALSSWRALGILLALALLLDLLMFSESPVVLFPLAIHSAMTVPLLLGMVYSLFAVMALRKDNTYQRLSQAWLPLTAGFTIAMLQIVLFDILRLTLTGTWGGFPLG
jgi:uncharacterized membrane protein